MSADEVNPTRVGPSLAIFVHNKKARVLHFTFQNSNEITLWNDRAVGKHSWLKKTQGYIINDDKLIPLRNVSVCEMNGVPILAKECTNHLSPRIGGFTEKFRHQLLWSFTWHLFFFFRDISPSKGFPNICSFDHENDDLKLQKRTGKYSISSDMLKVCKSTYHILVYTLISRKDMIIFIYLRYRTLLFSIAGIPLTCNNLRKLLRRHSYLTSDCKWCIKKSRYPFTSKISLVILPIVCYTIF